MIKKRILLVALFFFVAGFLTHAFFFPAVLTNNLVIFTKKSLQKKAPLPAVESPNRALTLVSYEEGEFDPQVAIVGKSYYLGITNKSSKELMTLISENPLLNTPRGYGESEQLLVQLYDVGEYTVSSSLHPDRVLKVIVK